MWRKVRYIILCEICPVTIIELPQLCLAYSVCLQSTHLYQHALPFIAGELVLGRTPRRLHAGKLSAVPSRLVRFALRAFAAGDVAFGLLVVFVVDDVGDGLGDVYSAEALRVVLDVTDEVLVPMLTQPMCFDPTARTIRKILEPRGLPYRVFINDWHARDGRKWLEETQRFVHRRGYPLAKTAVRHYMIHTNASS